MEFKDENGETVTAFTQEELDEKINEEKTKYEQEKTNLAKQLEEANNKIVELGEKNKDVSQLRKTKDSLEVKIAEMETNHNKAISEITASLQQEKIEKKLNEITGGDETLKEAVRKQLGKFSGDPQNDEELGQRITDAFILAREVFKGSTLSKAAGVGSTPYSQRANSQTKLSAEALEVANKLGISQEKLKENKLI